MRTILVSSTRPDTCPKCGSSWLVYEPDYLDWACVPCGERVLQPLPPVVVTEGEKKGLELDPNKRRRKCEMCQKWFIAKQRNQSVCAGCRDEGARSRKRAYMKERRANGTAGSKKMA